MSISDVEEALFAVVANQEEQYSLWPAQRELPAGWRLMGKSGTKSECLAYVDAVWTEALPLSLRTKMQKAVRKGAN